MKCIAIITEYSFENRSLLFSNESREFLTFLKSDFLVYVVDPSRNTSLDNFLAINFNSGLEERVDPWTIDLMYCALVGKDIEEIDQTNCMALQLQKFCDFLDLISPLQNTGLKIINPLSVMKKNFSKSYLLDLQNKQIPVIPTTLISTIDELKKLKSSGENYLLKPLISERSYGVKLLSKLSDEELDSYFVKYSSINSSDSSLYANLMNNQGIIAQPFKAEFKLGEIKVAFIGGEITLTRLVTSSNKNSVAVSVHTGGENTSYNLTSEELLFVNLVAKQFSQQFKSLIFRIDFIRTSTGFLVSEIEAINPSFATRHKNLFSNQEKIKHFSSLKNLFLKQLGDLDD